MKRIIGLSVAAAIVLLFCFTQPPEGLGVPGWRMIGVLSCTVLLWVTEALPTSVVGLLVIPLMGGLSIMDYSDIWASSVNQAFFFMLGSFGVSAAVTHTVLAKRILRALLRWSGNNPGRIVAAFVFSTAIISIALSDLGTVVLMVGFGLAFLELTGQNPGSRMGKCIMLGIPLGAMAGGVMTPISNTINVLALSILERDMGISISFVQWMVFGVPMALVLTPLAAWSLVRFFKPDPIAQEGWEDFMAEVENIEPWTGKETRLVVILVAMVVCWIAGSWIDLLTIAFVSIVGLVVMMLPGINLFTGEQYIKAVQPEPVILFTCAAILAAGMTSSGAGAWIVQVAFGDAGSWAPAFLLLAISVAACIAHILIPNGPAVIVVTMSTMLTAAAGAGLDPVAVMFILALWGSTTYTLPLDGLYLLTHPYGYYGTLDLIKYGTIPTAYTLFLSVTFVPVLSTLVGII